MTGVPSQKRWIKKFLGKVYSISCRQLNRSATEQGSEDVGNAWWEARVRELLGCQGQPHRRSDAIVEALEVNLEVKIKTSQEATEAVRPILATSDTLPDWFTETRLGKERLHRIKEGVTTLMGQPDDRQRTVGGQLSKWLALLRTSVEQKRLSIGRYKSYRRSAICS
jgi:hypothetical protein